MATDFIFPLTDVDMFTLKNTSRKTFSSLLFHFKKVRGNERRKKNLLASSVMAYKLQHVPEDHQRFHSISPLFVFSQEKKHTKFLRARPKAFAIRSHGNDFRPLYLTATLSRFFHVLSLSRLSKCCIFQPHSFLNFNFLSFSLRKYVHIRRVDGKR